MDTEPSITPAPGPDRITQALGALERGDTSASEELFPLVYGELRALAGAMFRGRNVGNTLQPTAVVHEAYLKLVGKNACAWRGREHFLAVAARAMRQVLADHARGRDRAKRGGGWNRVTLDAAADPSQEVDASPIAELDGALTRLEALSERQARIVELRYFGGMTIPEAARVLRVSPRTVDSEWLIARAWLRAELAESR